MLVASYSLAVCNIPVVMFRSKRVTVCSITLVEAAICAARSKLRLLLISCFTESLLSLITLRAIRLSGFFSSRTISDRSISPSKVCGLASDIRILSFSCPFSSLTAASSIAIRLAACSVMNELTTQVTKISNIVPLSTSSLSRRLPSGNIMLYPTNTAASVAAAWALLKPNIIIRSMPRIL